MFTTLVLHSIFVTAVMIMQISGVTATIFGCSGFLGRYITNYLARAGSQCVIPHRADEVNVQYLKQMGDLGMVSSTSRPCQS